jgi:hypothetical protein
MTSGRTEHDVARMLLGGAEYQAAHPDNTTFIQGLYADILGRPADAAGLAAWQQMLQSGTTRDQAIQAFLNSAEANTRVIGQCYDRFLDRNLDAAARDYWLGQIQAGQLTPPTVCRLVLSSDEYFSRARAVVPAA